MSSPMPARSPDVDAVIEANPGWQGETLGKLRGIIHAADPEITEAVKWKRPSNPLGSITFERDGIVCIVVVLKERVRLSFPDGSHLPDPRKLFNAQLNGKSRAIDFPETTPLDTRAIAALVRASAAQRTHMRPVAKNVATKARRA